jgi:tellurite resistance protein TerC
MNEHPRRTWQLTVRTVRRIAIAVIGGTVVLLGVAMLVLPGPGMLTILGGLAILGAEFAFARRWLQKARHTTHRAVRKATGRASGPDAPPPAPPAP